MQRVTILWVFWTRSRLGEALRDRSFNFILMCFGSAAIAVRRLGDFDFFIGDRVIQMSKR